MKTAIIVLLVIYVVYLSIDRALRLAYYQSEFDSINKHDEIRKLSFWQLIKNKRTWGIR